MDVKYNIILIGDKAKTTIACQFLTSPSSIVYLVLITNSLTSLFTNRMTTLAVTSKLKLVKKFIAGNS